MSYPPPITAVKLRVSTGSSTDVEIFEQDIPPSALSGITNNSVQITNNNGLLSAFSNEPPGTIFNASIITTFSDDILTDGYFVIIPSNSNFVPNPIQASLSLDPLPQLNSLSPSFSLNDYITKNSPAPLSFSSNNTSVLTVSSAGLVTIQGEGQATITITQPASTDGVYTAASVQTELIVSAPPPSGLIARYPFESNGNDISTNNNNLTNNNTVTFNTINYNQGSGAASFNGSNYFEIANNGRFSPDNFTVAFWIKPVSSNGFHQAIASCRNMSNNVVTGWLIYIDPASNLTFITGGGGSGFYGTGNIYTNFGGTVTTWVHVAITMTKSTRAVVLYINGNLYTTSVVGAYSNNTGSNLRIGAGANEQQNAEFFLRNGTLLDDFRIYDSALSASQVRAVMANL